MGVLKARIRSNCNNAVIWTSVNPILILDEVGFEKDTGKIKIGDGVTDWATLAYVTHPHPEKEPVLGNPSANGQVLASTTEGVRSWINPGNGYALNVQALTSSPVDSATVYFGMLPKAPTTTANISKVYIRKAGTIKIAEIYCYSGTAGTGEAWSLYIRKNNSADTLIATLSVATSERVFSNAALNISVAAGDYIEIKGVQPLWATNPATTIYGGYIYIE